MTRGAVPADLRRAIDTGDATGVVAAGRLAWDVAVAGLRWRDAAAVARHVANFLTSIERLSDGVRWAERAARAAARSGDAGLEAAAFADLGSALVEAGDPARGAAAIRRCVRLLGEADLDRPTRRGISASLAIAYWALGLTGHSSRAQRHLLDDLAADGEWTAARDQVHVNLLNDLRYRIDEYEDLGPGGAADLVAEASALAAEIEPRIPAMSPLMSLMAATVVGIVHARTGDVARAVRWFRWAIDTRPAVVSPFRTTARAELARVLHDTGDRAEAAALAAEARRALWADRTDARSLATWEQLAIVRLAPVTQQWEEALACQAAYTAKLRRQFQEAFDDGRAPLVDDVTERMLAMENADLREHNAVLAERVAASRRAAELDPLTGLGNRRAIGRAFDRLRSLSPLSVAMLDVDHFKAVNDGHSHVVGDEVLRTLAGILQAAVRGPDVVGRFGGEEFTILLCGADLAEGVVAAERVRAAVEEHDWSALVPGLAVTVSIGLTAVVPDDGFTTAVARADRALYRAKHEGRNRVCEV